MLIDSQHVSEAECICSQNHMEKENIKNDKKNQKTTEDLKNIGYS